jgi:putative membrane protein
MAIASTPRALRDRDADTTHLTAEEDIGNVVHTRWGLVLAGTVIALTLAGCGEQKSSAPEAKAPAEKAMAENTADGPDNAFIMKAANSDMFEIESSKIAAERAKDPDIKKFAEQMIADHTKSSSGLKAAAGDKVPTDPEPATVARIEKIKAASDDDFDAAYVDEQKAAHDEAVGLFTTASENADDPKIKDFAAKTLPTLKEHQEHVKNLNMK